MATLSLYLLTQFPDPSYREVWVDGGLLVATRTIKILGTSFVLLMAILGLGLSATIKQRTSLKETNLSIQVAVFCSGFSLLNIIGSFVSFVPNIGKVFLATIIYVFTFIGLTSVIEWRSYWRIKALGRIATIGKLDFVLFSLISVFALIVFAHFLVLETYSDVLQIYLPFFEYFDSAGSSQAILEKPAFSSFLQLRGLGTHLSATAIGGWTSAQAGSLLALILILIIVTWGVSDYTKRIFGAETLKSSWTLPLGAILVVLFFYSSSEINSKPHLVSFSLLIALTASLPLAFDRSVPECLLFRKTSKVVAIAFCVVYPLNFVAVILVVFVNSTIFWIFQKTLPIVQIFRNLAWASLSTAIVYITNLCFVGVFGTEPVIRSVKVGYIFDKFSSESIWQALYSSQSLNGFRGFLKWPFSSEGLFLKESIFALINLLNQNSYLFFVVVAFGIVMLFCLRLKASILVFCGGSIISVAQGWQIYRNFDNALHNLALFLGISVLCIFVEICTVLSLSQRKSPNFFKDLFLYSPFSAIIVTLSLVAIANVVFNQPSFNRIALQGDLGVVLLPCALVFLLAKLLSSLTLSDKRHGASVRWRDVRVIRRIGSNIVFTTGRIVSVIMITQLVFPQRKQVFLSSVVLIPLILNLVIFRVWQKYPIRYRDSNECLTIFATTWIVVASFFAAVSELPNYPRSTSWSFIDFGEQIALDFRKLTGSSGHLPDLSEVRGYHTKKDILRCLELASIVPSGSKIFPVNGLQEFAACQGTPGLNRGQLIHHYDSILAPRFDEIVSSDIQHVRNIFLEKKINYLVMLKSDCNRFLISQNVAFDANNLKQFRLFGRGSDFVVFEISYLSQAKETSFRDNNLPEYLGGYSVACDTREFP